MPDLQPSSTVVRGANRIPYYDDNVQLLVRRDFSQLQKEEYIQNDEILGNVNKNLNTVRRQVQIIEDSSQRKGNTLFLLNAVLTALLIAFIPVVLYMKGILGYGVFSIIIIVITIVFMIVIFFNLKSVRSRTANRFSSRNFDVPEAANELKPSASSCPLTPDQQKQIEDTKKNKSIQEISDLENEVKRLMETKNASRESRDKLETLRKELSEKYRALYPNA